ncbi:unnamed protein product, partial [Timema podura]|nr:unnamed protein product [Timema podura]
FTAEEEDETKDANAEDSVANESDDSDSDSDDDDNDYDSQLKTSIKDESVDIRCQNVVDAHPNFQDYKYDSENELWCEITFGLPLTSKKLDLSTLLKDVAEKSIVWEVPLIRRAFTYENPDTHLLTLKTDGINIQVKDWTKQPGLSH